jgi:hypothetical protein
MVKTTTSFALSSFTTCHISSLSELQVKMKGRSSDDVKEVVIRHESEGLETNENDWSLMESVGATLLRLRKEEEEIMLGIPEVTTGSKAGAINMKIRSEVGTKSQKFMEIDFGTATDLDNAVQVISSQEFREGMTVLPMTKFRNRRQSLDKSLPDMPLSRPEHYSDRIDRDKRMLTIGVAEAVDDPSQWRRFQDENGGIKLLLMNIQKGANFVRHEQGSDLLLEEYDEAFSAACNSCRALRDLCSISDDLRAVVTDDILRANGVLSDNALIKDLANLLRHANEVDILYSSRLASIRPKSHLFRLLGRKDRRGKFSSKLIALKFLTPNPSKIGSTLMNHMQKCVDVRSFTFYNYFWPWQ